MAKGGKSQGGPVSDVTPPPLFMPGVPLACLYLDLTKVGPKRLIVGTCGTITRHLERPTDLFISRLYIVRDGGKFTSDNLEVTGRST